MEAQLAADPIEDAIAGSKSSELRKAVLAIYEAAMRLDAESCDVEPPAVRAVLAETRHEISWQDGYIAGWIDGVNEVATAVERALSALVKEPADE